MSAQVDKEIGKQGTTRTVMARGYVYRGELVHEYQGGAAIWPTWLVGERVDFADAGEAEAFVDAANVDVLFLKPCPSVYSLELE